MLRLIPLGQPYRLQSNAHTVDSSGDRQRTIKLLPRSVGKLQSVERKPILPGDATQLRVNQGQRRDLSLQWYVVTQYTGRHKRNDALQSLCTTIVEFRMHNETAIATKSQVVQWLREVLVASELNDSIETLAGRRISSLCAQKLMVKIDTGTYRLSEQIPTAMVMLEQQL